DRLSGARSGGTPRTGAATRAGDCHRPEVQRGDRRIVGQREHRAMSDELPLANAQRRLAPIGRPKKAFGSANPDKTRTLGSVSSAQPRMNSEDDESRALAFPAGARPSRRLLTLPEVASYLNLSLDVVTELLDAGTFPRVAVRAPVTDKRRTGIVRKVLVDVADLDQLISTWKVNP